MKHDIFDFHHDMTCSQRFWRIAFLMLLIAVLLADLFYWRPA